MTGRAGLKDRQHRPGPKHRAAAACSRAPTDPRPPPGPGWLRPGAEQPGRGVAGARAPAAAGLGAPGRPPPSCPHLTPPSPGQSQAQRGHCSRGFPSAPLARSKPCPLCTRSFEPGSCPWFLLGQPQVTPPAATAPSAYFLLPFPFSTAASEFCGADGKLALHPGGLPRQRGSGGRCRQGVYQCCPSSPRPGGPPPTTTSITEVFTHARLPFLCAWGSAPQGMSWELGG